MPQPDKTASPYRGSLRQPQFRSKTDPTFYPTARLAMESPQERYAYVTAIAPDRKSRADSVFVVDVGAGSGSFGKVIGQMDLPDIGDELHHFGWNACSTALCPYAPHPGLRSSRIHIIDTKPDPTNLEIVKTIEPDEVFSACRLFRHQPQRGRIFLGGREASMSLIH